MKYLLALLVLLNIADGIITNALVGLGLGREANPFLMQSVGQPSFLIMKVVGVLFASLLLWDIHRRSPRLAVATATGGVTLYAGIVAWNSFIFFV